MLVKLECIFCYFMIDLALFSSRATLVVTRPTQQAVCPERRNNKPTNFHIGATWHAGTAHQPQG
jgi:hypothetical protein